jgi:hypothetical protein
LPSLFVRPSTFHILIFSSETTGPIAAKLWWNGCRTQFWKGTTQGLFQQSLVEIGSVVSEKIFFKFHPPFFLFLAWRPSWLEVGITGHNFGRGLLKDHSTKAAIGPVVSEEKIKM